MERRGGPITVERLRTGEHGGHAAVEVAFERAIRTASARVNDRDHVPETLHSRFPVGVRHVLERLEARDDARPTAAAGSDTSGPVPRCHLASATGKHSKRTARSARSAVRWSRGPPRCSP